jgi:predicted ATPase
MEEGLTRAFESNHPSTRANVNYYTAIFEIARGNVDPARRAAENVVEVSREHGLTQFALWGSLLNAWARARFGDRDTGLAEIREALEAYIGQGGQRPLYHGLLAEFAAERQGAEAALARTNAALACARETGERWTDAYLHRIRGEILLKPDPANTAVAEEAFLTAIALAQQQGAELRAARDTFTGEALSIERPRRLTRMPSSRPRLKVFRRRHSFQRSQRRNGSLALSARSEISRYPRL